MSAIYVHFVSMASIISAKYYLKINSTQHIFECVVPSKDGECP